MKKLLLCASALALCAALSSCGLPFSVSGRETTDAPTQPATVYVPATDAPVTEPTTEEPTTGEPLPTLIMDDSYEMMNMASADVMGLYTSVMNDVKTVAPGFTKSETQQTYDVATTGGDSLLAGRVIGYVADSILGGSDGSLRTYVSSGSELQVRERFPLYGSSFGCELENYDIIDSAVCYRSPVDYKLVIRVRDCLNPAMDGDFAKIITPVDAGAVRSGMPALLSALSYNSFVLNMNYTGCEITCVVDRYSSRMKSLSYKTVTDVDVNVGIELPFVGARSVSCSGTVVEHVDFFDFDWPAFF